MSQYIKFLYGAYLYISSKQYNDSNVATVLEILNGVVVLLYGIFIWFNSPYSLPTNSLLWYIYLVQWSV